jgi:choline dehydrogenase-like flavoprotein
MEVWGGLDMPSYGFGFDPNELNVHVGKKVGGYGDQLRKDIKSYYGSVVGISGRGECIARENNYCEIDPHVVDEFGIPVLRFNYTWSEHELRQSKHMHETFDELLTAIGGVPLGNKPGKEDDYGLEAPGRIIHEVGTTRMGTDPTRSVVNTHQQLHDAKNVFIVDGGPFVSQADKNPTWTILALSWRTCDYIVDQLKKQNI